MRTARADGVRWNTTFKAFADFWGFEPRLCRAYRAQTKGKVFGDRVIASAILDRILHHATTISIRGDSYRLKDKLKSGVVKPTTAGA